MGWLPKFRIAQKLPLAMVGMAIVVGVGIGTAGYIIGLETLKEQRRAALQGSVTSAAGLLSDYFTTTELDLKVLAGRADTATALENFSRSVAELSVGTDAKAVLQKVYITDNKNPADKRLMLDTGNGMAGSYDGRHKSAHGDFRSLLQARGLADILLIDAAGQVVYSTAKHMDFGATLAADDKTGLGLVYKKAIKQPQGVVSFVDFTNYAAADNQPLSFIAAPVFKKGASIGVLAFALSTDALSHKLQSMRGLGKTGEVLFVGGDGLLRSESVFSPESDGLVTSIGDDVMAAAESGAVSSGSGYRGTPLMAASISHGFKGVNWNLVAVQAEEEVLAPAANMRNTMIGVGTGLLAIAAILAFLFSRALTKPISRLTRTMNALAEGHLETEVEGAKRGDEIGAMARAVGVFKENALKVNEMTEGERTASIQRRTERTQMMQQLQLAFGEVVGAATNGDFSRRVEAEFPDEELNALAHSVNELVETVDRGLGETGEVLAALANTDLTHRVEGEYQGAFERLKTDTNAVAERLSEIVTGLQQTSRGLKMATSEILSGANDLSERTTKQAATIEETSAAMEQLSGTVLANAERAKDASSVAATVTRTAEEGGQVMHHATEAMERITQSSGKISNIIGMIDDIAFQTNLLALNASVEAARAGDAGKGFAVVAVEVRRLAQSAAGASAEVKKLIEQSGTEVRGGSRLVAEAAAKLEAMLVAARSSNELMDSIARASQEQASAIEEVNAAVRQMDEMTQHNAALVEETNAAIEQTEAQAVELDRIVDVFNTTASAPAASTAPAKAPASGIRALQEKVRTAARSYLAQGNAAIDKDWSEF